MNSNGVFGKQWFLEGIMLIEFAQESVFLNFGVKQLAVKK